LTDTVNHQDEDYGHTRLVDAINSAPAAAPHILAHILKDLEVFAGPAPQPDDITLLIVAMKDGGGVLTIRSGLNPEGQLIISISDTGIGLPAENKERMFDAFHTTKPKGTGMGLAITRSILEAHGGRIWATDNPGAGATFHFTLPVEAEEPA
jgi:signal transduction histidine kinase